MLRRITHWLDRITGAESRVASRVMSDLDAQRRWEAAATNRLNAGHWGRVTGAPINAAMYGTLDELRNRCEEEAANNPLVEGMVSTYALSIIGPEGPTLRVDSGDEDYDQQREAVWNEWADNAGSNQQLSLADLMGLWIRDLFFCGEFLDQMIVVRDAPGPVKMRLLPIHPRRLSSPAEFIGDPAVAMGVRRDLRNRRPTHYYLAQPQVFGPFELDSGEFLEVPYRDLLHGFVVIEEDQVRGVPWLAPCLDAIASLRDLKEETLDAVRNIASWSVLLKSNHPDAVFWKQPESTTVQRRTIRAAPPGWEATSLAPTQPGPNFLEYYESQVREIGRPVNMPLMMLLLDSSAMNYSSARFDGQMFWRGGAKVQGFLGRTCSRLESEVAREAELAGALPPPLGKITRRWLWPKAPHVDPVKEADAERLALENGTLTYSEACAAHNKDVQQVIAERERDNDALVKAGLRPLLGIPEKSAPASPGDTPAAAENTKPANGKSNGRFSYAP